MKARVPIKDADTGAVYYAHVEVPEYAPTHVKVTFGNHFSIELEMTDAHYLAETVLMAVQQAAENDPEPNFFNR